MKPVLKEYLSAGATVVDVRSPEEFQQGHCSKSINIPLQTLEQQYKKIDTTKPVIVCCASGARSAMALSILKNHGFEKVINAGSWTCVP